MPSSKSCLVSLAASLIAVNFGCGKSTFASKNISSKNEETQKTGLPSESDASNNQKQSAATPQQPASGDNKPNGVEPFGENPPLQAELDACSGQTKFGSVLIIDLKSGWLAGDGGTFFKDELDPKCPNAGTISIDYYHITQAVVESNNSLNDPNDPNSKRALACSARMSADAAGFLEGKANPQDVCSFNSFAQYSQIWILSGDELDPLDILTRSPLFSSLLSRLDERVKAAEKSPVGIFLGSGLSNISHGNAAARAILSSDVPVFERNAQVAGGVFPSPDYVSQFNHAPLKASVELSPAAGFFAEKFAVFAGMQSLFDYGAVNISGIFNGISEVVQGRGNSIFTQIPKCFTDPVSNPSFTVVARDSCNQPAIAFLDRPGVRILAEGNMARFYGLSAPQEYLTRIARFLSLSQK